LLVDRGFELMTLDVRAGDGMTLLDGIDVENLKVEAAGLARVMARGNISTVKVVADDLSSVMLDGIEESAKVKVDATAVVFLTGDEDKTITGSVYGLGTVYVDTSASCVLSKGSSHYSAKCKHFEGYDLPEISFTWTEYAYFSGYGSCDIRPDTSRRSAVARSKERFGGKEGQSPTVWTKTSSRRQSTQSAGWRISKSKDTTEDDDDHIFV